MADMRREDQQGKVGRHRKNGIELKGEGGSRKAKREERESCMD